MHWTAEQILALAPDPGSAKSGQSLAAARKWVSFGCDEQTAWGECQGSGKLPYQTRIDLSEPAFRCTCPSRKFPCKHALGLFLLLANQPAAFTNHEPPAWMLEWLASRSKRAEQRATKQASAEPVRDEAAQAKRARERHAKVAAGLEELERWMCDLVRHGLAAAQTQPHKFWETTAARMVDAQAPGVARLVREMAGIPASGDGWQERLLEQLAKLFLLREGFKRIDALPTDTQADIRASVGWTQNQDELLAQTGVRDHWLVLGQRVEGEDHLRVQRTWLWGKTQARAALVLHFAPGNQPLDTSLLPGTEIDAELSFYSGACPLRALLKQRHAASVAFNTVQGYAEIAQAIEAYGSALSRNPWLERFPMLLETVTPARRGGQWIARDTQGKGLLITPRFESGWQLLALSGGHPLTLFGEWDGEHLLPFSVLAAGRFVSF